MSVKIMAMVFDYDMPDLTASTDKVVSSSTAKFVLIALADHANEAGESVYPSINRIAKKTGLSEMTVSSAMNALKQAGYITYEGYSSRGTKEYSLNVEKLKEPSTPPQTQFATKPSLLPTQTEFVSNHKPSLVKPSLNHPLTTPSLEEEFLQQNPPPPVSKPRSAEEIRAMTMGALAKGYEAHKARQKEGISDGFDFPPEVQAVISKVSALWKITPPRAKDSRFKFWIRGAKDLQEACGEFGLGLLDEVYESWKASGYMVASPSSLVNSAVALAGRKRGQASDIAPAVDESLSYHWNSEISVEENQRLMEETIKRVKEAKERK